MAPNALLILSSLLAASQVLQQADAGWLPRLFCNNLKSRFLRLGCYDEQSTRCNLIYSQIVFPLLGIPACDFVTCTGYGNALGTCVADNECFRDNPNAFCESGQVCCEVLTTTTTTTTTTQRPGGNSGGSSSDSSSSGGSSSSGSSGSFAADNDFGVDKNGDNNGYDRSDNGDNGIEKNGDDREEDLMRRYRKFLDRRDSGSNSR